MSHNTDTQRKKAQYDYTSHTTKSLLIELEATKNSFKVKTSNTEGWWRNGMLATISHIESELEKRKSNLAP
jgi:predicted nucleotidyltransferase